MNPMLFLGDSIAVLKSFNSDSIDAVVTDPPYGLSFMNKHWDYDVPSVELWREVFRVLKPGGHVLSFGGTRTYHRMVVNIEDAGFEIRDQLAWLYGSGFPKSHDVSKAFDRTAGVEGEIIGVNPSSRPNSKKAGMRGFDNREGAPEETAGVQHIRAPATDLAKQWQGWGTALKPANEPIVLARKPLVGTVAANVEKFGTGALNIDASRIAPSDPEQYKANATRFDGKIRDGFLASGMNATASEIGRWPANVLFDEEAAAVLDAQSGMLKSGAMNGTYQNTIMKGQPGKRDGNAIHLKQEASSGGASRFFYVAKASKRERGEGNVHPTVKPIKLMEYLVRLITPPGGTVLDPFMGSGTTGVAANNLGFQFAGIELDVEYFKIASRRIAAQPFYEATDTEHQLGFEGVIA